MTDAEKIVLLQEAIRKGIIALTNVLVGDGNRHEGKTARDAMKAALLQTKDKEHSVFGSYDIEAESEFKKGTDR